MNPTELIIKIDVIYFLGIIGSLIAIVWFAGTKWGKVETSIKWIKDDGGKVETSIKWIKDDISWIKEEIRNIWEAIREPQLKKTGVAGTGSPMNPTELGWKYLRESGLADVIDKEKKDELLKKLKESLPNDYTNYDVQEVASDVVFTLENDLAVIKPIKEYAFENGIDPDMILKLGGYLLRDNFLGREHHIALPDNQNPDNKN